MNGSKQGYIRICSKQKELNVLSSPSLLNPIKIYWKICLKGYLVGFKHGKHPKQKDLGRKKRRSRRDS